MRPLCLVGVVVHVVGAHRFSKPSGTRMPLRYALRGCARTGCRARHRFCPPANPLDHRPGGGLRLLDRTALPRITEPALELLVALTPRLRPEVVADRKSRDLTNHVAPCAASQWSRTPCAPLDGRDRLWCRPVVPSM